MTAPALNPTLVQVRGGPYRRPGGVPAAGSVTFRLSSWAQFPAANTITVPAVVHADLDEAGRVAVLLAATDDPQLVPLGLTYLVSEQLDGVRRSYPIVVPRAAAPAGLDLADLSPAVPGPLLTQYALAGEVASKLDRAEAAGFVRSINGSRPDPETGALMLTGLNGPGVVRFRGDGPPPDLIVGASPGDLYVDLLTGTIYELR